MRKKIYVIGAGIAGLNVGIELLQKGHEVTLIEKNESTGGLCSGYEINNIYIDTCIHWLMGTKKNNRIYKLWNNIDAINDDVKIIRLENFVSIDYQGTIVRLGRNIEKTKKEWLAISKEDKKAINDFFSLSKVVAKIMQYALKTNFKKKPSDIFKILYRTPSILKSMNVSREKYAQKFKNPALRFAITNMMTGYNSMFFLFDVYGLFINDNADIPCGGAKYLNERIQNKFLALGGNLLLNEEVININIENKQVSSISTNKNNTFYPDYLISTIDPQYLSKNLLNDKYHIKRIQKAKKMIDINPTSSCFNVYFQIVGGVFPINGPTVINIDSIKIGAKERDYLLIRPYDYDEAHFVKNNKTVVSLFVDQNHDDYLFYESLSEDELKIEEERIVNSLFTQMIKKYPHFAQKIQYIVSVNSPI